MTPPPGYSDELFDDTFNGTGVNRDHWNTYLTSNGAAGVPWNADGTGGSGPNPGGFDAEYYKPNQVTVDNGLTLTATPLASHDGDPWTSGVVSTYGHFQFMGGYVQVRAKMAGEAGMWPGIWLLPGPAGTNGDDHEIDIFEGNYLNGGSNPNDNYAWHVESGAPAAGGVTTTGSDLSAGYNTYGLAWVPGQSVTYYLNGREVGQISSSQFSIANEPMELILSLNVGNSTSSSFRTTYPSPAYADHMQVAEVQVWQP